MPKTPASASPPLDGSQTRSAVRDDGAPAEASSDRTPSTARRVAMPDGEVPARIGRYLVIDTLGHGGMGVVFEAFDPELDRRIALKLLHPERARGTARLRLLREAQAMARLSHPNVAQVYDVGVDGDRVFMTMELVRGCTLSRWLGEQERSWPEIVARFVAAGRGLQAAHDVGLVHRDFKPHNVLIGDDGRVRVADFGLAGPLGDVEVEERSNDAPTTTSYLEASLTATGAVLGTPRYMAPEQHLGVEAGPAADQFALCVALHEALYGQHPFGGDTVTQLVVRVIEGDYREPESTASVPKWLQRAVHKGLSLAPDERHASITELLDVLEREPLRRRRRRWGLTGALVLGLGTSGASWLGARGEPPCRGSEAAMAEVWDDERRGRLEAALGAAPTTEVVTRALDGYAEEWIGAHRASCREHQDGSMSTATFDAAMGCLHRGRAALDGVVETVTLGDSEGRATEAAAAAAGLPALAHCRDPQRLSLEVEPPADPEQARAVAALRERLARAEAVHGAGALRTALDELSVLAQEIDAVDYAPLRAERDLVSARLAMDRGDWSVASRELTESMSQALASRVDLVAAEAAARAVFVDAMVQGPEGPEPREQAVARSLVQRVGEPGDLAALLENNLGVVATMSGDQPGARRSFARALELADHAEGVDPVDHCGYIINLALATADVEPRDALFERAWSMAERALGPNHERTIDVARLRAEYTVEPALAQERLAPVCDQLRDHLPTGWSRCHQCNLRLAELRDLSGRTDSALAALDGADHCLARAEPVLSAPAEREEVEVRRRMIRGHAAVLRGDHAEALAELRAAERRLEPQRELPWIALDLADLVVLRARSLQALGRGSEAIPSLREAIAIFEEGERLVGPLSAQRRHSSATALLDELEAAQRRRSMP